MTHPGKNRRALFDRLTFFLIIAAYLLYLGQERFGRMNDESLYIRIASEMLHRADWVIPTWFGHEAYYKPPLLYWSIFPFFKILGENLTAARLPSVLAAFLTLWFTYQLVKRFSTREAAILSTLLLATCLSFLRYARVAMMEPYMMFFFVVNLYALYKAHQNDSGPWTFWWFVTLGASSLVKGPVSILVLLLSAFLFSAVTREWKWMFRKSASPGMAIGAFLIVLWPILIAWHGDWSTWWNSFILRENFGKFHDIFYYSPNNLWKRFLVHLIPWSLFFVAALWFSFQKQRWKEPGVLLNLCFLISFFSVFLFPAARLYHYSITALPSGAMLLGTIYQQTKNERVFRWASVITGLITLAAGTILVLSVFAFNFHAAGPFVALAGLSLALTGIILLMNRELVYATAAMALAYLSSSLVAGLWFFPVFPSECKANVSGSPLCIVRQSPYIWSYEAGTRVIPVDSGSDCRIFLRSGGKALVAQSALEDFSASDLPAKSYRIVCQWPALRHNFDFHDFLDGWRKHDKFILEENMYLIEAAKKVDWNAVLRKDSTLDCRKVGRNVCKTISNPCLNVHDEQHGHVLLRYGFAGRRVILKFL